MTATRPPDRIELAKRQSDRRLATAAAWGGGLLAGAALLLALLPTSGVGYSCGSVLAPQAPSLGSTFAGTLANVSCSADIGSRRTIVIWVAFAAVSLIVGGLIARGKNSPPAPELAASSVPESKVASDLEKLARLHEAGQLSDSEFQAAKARTLGS